MRKCLFFSLFLLYSTFIQAQNAKADSLQLYETQMNIPLDSLEAQLKGESNDTIKVDYMGFLCFYYAWVDPQKGLEYGQKGLQISHNMGYKKGSAYCQQSMSFCLWVLGNYNEALRFALNSLKEYEELQDPKRIAYSNLAIANIYREIGDYDKGLQEAYRAIRIYDSIGFSQKVSYVVIGSIYERQNNLDSALKYIQEAYEMDIDGKKVRWGWLVYELGNIHSKMENYELALAYYRIAMPLVKAENVQKDIVDINNSLSALFKATDKLDSSIFYANEIVQKWKSTNYKKGILQAVNTLADIYRIRNQRDSVIRYLEMSAELNQELFIQEKQREVQNLAFNEQMRRREKELAEMQAAKERKRNLQLLAIGAFIVTFMVVVILLSRNKSYLKTARFLGLLGVLLVFEFISLFTHPWIEKVTNHNPVYTLIILVMLASILIPVHHYLEDLIKKKLVKRRTRKQVLASTKP